MRRSLGPLLCELHAHTRWSDGVFTVAELVDLHGRSGFDVLGITDHVVRRDDPWREHLGLDEHSVDQGSSRRIPRGHRARSCAEKGIHQPMPSGRIASVKVAIIDVGSNSVRLLVAEVDNGIVDQIHRERVYVRLGDDAYRRGKIGSRKLKETRAVASKFARIARKARCRAHRDHRHGARPAGGEPGRAHAHAVQGHTCPRRPIEGRRRRSPGLGRRGRKNGPADRDSRRRRPRRGLVRGRGRYPIDRTELGALRSRRARCV